MKPSLETHRIRSLTLLVCGLAVVAALSGCGAQNPMGPDLAQIAPGSVSSLEMYEEVTPEGTPTSPGGGEPQVADTPTDQGSDVPSGNQKKPKKPKKPPSR